MTNNLLVFPTANHYKGVWTVWLQKNRSTSSSPDFRQKWWCHYSASQPGKKQCLLIMLHANLILQNKIHMQNPSP